MKRSLLPICVAALLAAVPVGSVLGEPPAPAGADSSAPQTAAAAPHAHFLNRATFDLTHLLPPPPAPGSLAAAADIETVLQVQANRTEADVAWAKLIDHNVLFNNAMVLGPWFTEKNLPDLAKFFKEVGSDSSSVDSALKKIFNRPRPMMVDPRVHPCVKQTVSASYPSGHTLQAFVWAGVLAQIFPEKKDELFALAHRAAWGRILGGAHFPTDIVAGRMLAEAVVAEFLKNPEFHEAVRKARAEAEPFLLQKAA